MSGIKFNESVFNAGINTALNTILDQTAASLKPVLIIREDNPYHIYRIEKYFKKRQHSIYVRMGVSCAMPNLYEEILSQLDANHKVNAQDYHPGTLNIISQKISATRVPFRIVIDNCHRLVLSQIFFLLGLMNDLTANAQFLFLMPEPYLESWSRKHGRDRDYANYFLAYVATKYILSR